MNFKKKEEKLEKKLSWQSISIKINKYCLPCIFFMIGYNNILKYRNFYKFGNKFIEEFFKYHYRTGVKELLIFKIFINFIKN